MRTYSVPSTVLAPSTGSKWWSSWALASLLGAATLGCLAGVARAEDEEPPPAAPRPAAPEAAAPSQEQILAWVAQLGSDDFRLREEASARLAKVGEPAREALETAMKSSDSLEVRWRAQQLLLRLDGRQEKRLGAREPRRGAAPLPGLPPSQDELRRLLESDRPEEVREIMERLLRGMGPGSGFGQPPFAPLEGWNLFGNVVRSGDLTLRLSPFSDGGSRPDDGHVMLEVRGKDAAGMPTRATYRGASLEAILAANPALKDHPSLPGLEQELKRWQERRQASAGAMRAPLFSFATSQGIQIQQDANGVTVTLRERGEDGQTVTKEYKGASLEDIKREHPELAEKLGGISLGFGAPLIIRGQRGERLPPPMPAPPQVTPRDDAPRFGVFLEPVEGLLQRHLKLEQRGALIVAQVLPGSQAEAMGLQAMDILLDIDGTPIASMEDAIVRLSAAAKAKGALRLDVLRGGQPQVLTR